VARKQSKGLRWARETQLRHLPDVMTVEQAARYLGIGRNTAYEAVRKGTLPACRIGRLVRVPRVGLERFLASSLDTRAVAPAIEDAEPSVTPLALGKR